MIKPEERLALGLLARHKINKPPYDLETLIQHYANVEYKEFPTDADGVVLGVGTKSTLAY